MRYDVKTVDEYVRAVPEGRKEGLVRLRAVILDNLPAGFEEAMSYSLPSYVVPLSRYPAGYHCRPSEPLPFLSFASQKSFIGLYHLGIYADPGLLDWFTAEYADRVGGRLDMGKSCIRFKKPDKIPYDLVGELVAKVSVDAWIETYERELKR